MNTIRTAGSEDFIRIVQIYNQAVLSGFETADIDPVSLKDRSEWFCFHSSGEYPILVYDVDGFVAGWLCISPYRYGRKALKHTVEISYYVDAFFKRKGIGSELVKYAINHSVTLGYKTLFAIVLDKNEPSIRLLEKHNFSKWGHLPNVADFNGIECGHVYFGLRIS